MLCQNANSISFHFYENELFVRKCCFTDSVKIDFNEIEKIKTLDDLINKVTYKKTDRGLLSCKDQCVSKNINCIDLSGLRKCNLNCYHCWSEGHHFDDDGFEEKYFKFLKILLNITHLENLSLDGTGEIFMYWPKLKSFLRDLTSNNIKYITFITNATLINEQIVDDLLKIQSETGIKFKFYVSIDGITKKTYENIRVGGNFEKIVENIKLLSQWFNINFNFTLKKENYKEAFKLKKFLKDNFSFPHGGKANFLIDMYDLELNKYFKYLQAFDL